MSSSEDSQPSADTSANCAALEVRKDFIGLLSQHNMDHIVEAVLHRLDLNDLYAAHLVSSEWSAIIGRCFDWQRIVENRVKTDLIWDEVCDRRDWYLKSGPSADRPEPDDDIDYSCVAFNIIADIDQMEKNWRSGGGHRQAIDCQSNDSKGVYCLQYDDRKIVCGLRDHSIKIWDSRSLECFKTLTGHTGAVLCLQFDDRLVISGSTDATVRVWDILTGQELNALIHHCESVLCLRFADNILVTGSQDRSMAVWALTSGTDITLRRVLVGHRAPVASIALNDEYIVSGSGDRSVKVWRTGPDNQFVRSLLGHRSGITCLQYRHPLVVSGSSDKQIRVWDIESGDCLKVLLGHEDKVRCIGFSSHWIVSGAYDGSVGLAIHKLKVWDLKRVLAPGSQNSVLTLNEHKGGVFALHMDGSGIVSGSGDNTILIWQLPSTYPLVAPSYLERIDCQSRVYCLQSNERIVVCGLSNGTIQIWDRRSLECLKTLCGHTDAVICLGMDDTIIISGSNDTTVRIWDLMSGQEINVLGVHCEPVLSLRFDGHILVTASEDRSIAIWDVMSGVDIELRRVVLAHRAPVIAVDFDEKYIITGSLNQKIKVWLNITDCPLMRSLVGHKDSITCLQYRYPLVVSGSSDNTIRLWNVESGLQLRVFDGHQQSVRCVRFDDKRIVSGGSDCKIKVWDMNATVSAPIESNCIQTLVEHSDKVFGLQMDDFQIVSASNDDLIVIHNFFPTGPPQEDIELY